MEKTAQGRVCSSLLYGFRPSFVLLVSSIVLTSYLSFGFYPILAIPLWVLSTVLFFTFLKTKRIWDHNIVEVENLINAHKNLLEREDEAKPKPENETLSQRKVDQIHDCAKVSQAFPLNSGSEDDSASEDFELKWTSHNYAGDSLISSSDDDDDDDNLIEIALPRQRIGLKEGKKLRPQKNLPDLFMELSAEVNEMNEEENLIEIDISMGSMMKF